MHSVKKHKTKDVGREVRLNTEEKKKETASCNTEFFARSDGIICVPSMLSNCVSSRTY